MNMKRSSIEKPARAGRHRIAHAIPTAHLLPGALIAPFAAIDLRAFFWRTFMSHPRSILIVLGIVLAIAVLLMFVPW
ncbi:hypothetical protein ACILG0_08635 [Pseudomonadota bacterium AL_CKDN230030165-1A_HGKHYDSX7]